MLTEQDFRMFTKLRIGAFGRKIQEIIEDQSWDSVGFEDKIAAALDAEIEARHNRRVAKLISKSHFKLKDACPEEIIYLPERSLTPDRIMRFCACEWIKKAENLLIISATGSGKSYIAQAIGNAAMRKEISAFYVTMSDLERMLDESRANGTYYRLIDQLSDVELLILDDLFTTAPSQSFVTELFHLIDLREGRTSTIVCSQSTPDVWYEVIGIEVIADSLLNRLVKNARVITIEGPNMREVLAKKKESAPDYWK